MKPGPIAHQAQAKNCEYCHGVYERRRFDSKLEDMRHYQNRRYCSRLCADNALKQRAKNNYEANKAAIREKKRASMKALRMLNPDKYNRQSRETKARERSLLFEMYGHICVRCGFADKRALTLDHVKNNGSTERSELGERGVYRRAKSSHLPDDYQILCMNCQFIKRVETQRQNQHSTQQQHGAS